LVKQAFFKTIKMKKYRALRPFYLGKVEGKDVEVTQNEIIELPESVGKTMVGNGWMVEVKEEPKTEETTEAEVEEEVKAEETTEAKEEPKPKK
jgi:glycine cleavage system H lipoate-binding protein